MTLRKTYTLIGPNGRSYQSPKPGSLGGHRGSRIYGLLDCRVALQAITRGGYVKHRVFYLDEATAIAAGYRPCAVCLPEKYVVWKKCCLSSNRQGAPAGRIRFCLASKMDRTKRTPIRSRTRGGTAAAAQVEPRSGGRRPRLRA
jgi:hypothetical protein